MASSRRHVPVSSSPLIATLLILILSTTYLSNFTIALDIEFDSIQCDTSLSAYVLDGDLQMTCDDGSSTKCSFGQDAVISGTMQYHSLSQYSSNGLGYVSANLRLMSVRYDLLELFPIDLCGDWIESYTGNSSEICPGWDGSYYFSLPYTLPYDKDDITTWLATGWQGVSRLNIYAGASASSTLLTDCKLYWHIYVTPPTDEVDGWKQLPSGAQVGVVVASILAFFCCCCSYLTCCRRRRRHVANNIESDDGDLTAFKVLDDKEDKRKGRKKNRWSKSIYRDFVAIDR